MKLLVKKSNVTEAIFYSFIILFMMFREMLNLNAIFFGVDSSGYRILKIVLLISTTILFLLTIQLFLTRLKKITFFWYCMLFILALYTYFFSSGAEDVYKGESLWSSVFVFSATALLLIPEIKDFSLFLGIYKYYSIAIVIYATIILVFRNIGSSYMGFSYSMLLCVLILFYLGLFKNDRLSILFSVLGIAVDIAGGTRGSIICILAMILSFLVLSKKWKECFLILFMALIIAFNFDSILNRVSLILNYLNIDSRIVDALYSTNMSGITFANGRLSITNACIELIKNNPLGYGFLGERAPLNSKIWWFGTDGYAHNIFIEFILQYGVIIACNCICFCNC